MNRGAAQATGNVFVFLHADTRPPQNFEDLIFNIFTPLKRLPVHSNLGSIPLCRAFALSSALQTGVPDI